MTIVTVIKRWDNTHGPCGDCGDPAVFVSPYRYWNKTERPDSPPPVSDSNKLCAVCAAQDACDGETIMRLWVDDSDPPVSDEHRRVLDELKIDYTYVENPS